MFILFPFGFSFIVYFKSFHFIVQNKFPTVCFTQLNTCIKTLRSCYYVAFFWFLFCLLPSVVHSFVRTNDNKTKTSQKRVIKNKKQNVTKVAKINLKNGYRLPTQIGKNQNFEKLIKFTIFCKCYSYIGKL